MRGTVLHSHHGYCDCQLFAELTAQISGRSGQQHIAGMHEEDLALAQTLEAPTLGLV
jgi:hypothetical protein